jgi:large subunit ribosomal protein L10
MPITKDQKKVTLDKIQSAVKDSSSMVFVNFHGLTVSESSEMRNALRASDVNYFVAKKTLIKKALEGGKFENEMPTLDGEVAIAYGSDAIAPAREVYSFQKKFDGKLAILGGVFEGAFKDKESMMSIATIPSLQVLYGQFVNLINSPIQGLVLALNAVAEKKQS